MTSGKRAKEKLAEASAGVAEVVVDLVTNNPVVKEIPVLGTAVKLAQAAASMRDQIFLNKVKHFIEHLPETTPEQRKRLLKDDSAKHRERIGNAVFHTIEQADELKKVEYVAAAFASYLAGEIEEGDLRLICHAIRTTFIGELERFIEGAYDEQEDLQYLVQCGLANVTYPPITWDGSTKPNLEISKRGQALRQAWQCHKKL